MMIQVRAAAVAPVDGVVEAHIIGPVQSTGHSHGHGHGEEDGHAFVPADSTTKLGGLLVLFSSFLACDGVVRTSSVVTTPPGQWCGGNGVFPPALVLAMGLGEFVFSFLGMAVGLEQVVFEGRLTDWRFTKATKYLLEILGWPLFIIEVFTHPAYNLQHGAYGLAAAGASTPQAQAWVSLSGILSLASLASVVQGFQFYLCFQIYNAQTGHPTPYYKPISYRLRLTIYATVQLLGGMCTAAFGFLVRITLGPGPLSPPVVLAPNVVFYPLLTIISGLLITAYASLALVCAWTLTRSTQVVPVTECLRLTPQGTDLFAGSKGDHSPTHEVGHGYKKHKLGAGHVPRAAVFTAMLWLGLILWLWLMGAHVLAQVGLAGPGAGGDVAVLALMYTGYVIVPAYLTFQLHNRLALR